ncbi:alpha-amylase family protein [Bradyrhizobium sp. 18BD]
MKRDERLANWIEHAVFWHIYPLGFVGAERVAASCPEVQHRLGRLNAWLDYAVDLGVSGLLLAPIFASSTHGYDTTDHFAIDRRLGDAADFDALANELHRRGLRLVLDGVFNHVGRDFPRFQRAIAGGPQAREAAWFHLIWKEQGGEPDYATFEGHRQLVTLNHAESAVADYVTGVMTHWLDRGADGWRLDAAYGVPRPFWREVLPRVREKHPDAYIFGEVIHGDYTAFVHETGVDAVTQYELWKAIWSALNAGNFFELAWALKRHNTFLDAFVPQTFVGNHDVTRIASRLTDERHLPHALAILVTVGGMPSIYYGDEQAFRGLKENRAGGDDAIRPTFPDSPAQLAPYGWGVYRLHQELIGLRRRHSWLHRAQSRVVEIRNTDLLLEAFDGEQRLWVALNVADASLTRRIAADADRLAGNALATKKGSSTEIVLPPHGWGIFGSPAFP